MEAVTDLEGAGTPMRYEGAEERLGIDMDTVDSFGRAAPGIVRSNAWKIGDRGLSKTSG